MADEWIKLRRNLKEHPKVVRMASALRADNLRVIGGLHAVWSVFDEFSEDGKLHGYTFRAMDAVIGWEGFSEAMWAVEWLTLLDGQTLVIPEFSEHNGASGKRRAQEAKRKRRARKTSAETSAKCPHPMQTKCGPEEEEEEEEEYKSKEQEQAVTFGDGSKPQMSASDAPIAGAKPHRLPIQPAHVVEIYNDVTKDVLPTCAKLSSNRRAQIAARIKDGLDSEKRWRNYFAYALSKPFLIGKGATTTGHSVPFRASLDWLIKEANFLKMKEGFYDRA